MLASTGSSPRMPASINYQFFNKMKTRLTKILIWSVCLLIFGIASLELYTRNCNCSVSVATSPEEMNFTISICEQDIGTYPFSYDLEQQQLIDEIIEKRNAGEHIEKEEYRSAMDLLVYEVPREYLEHVNGSCVVIVSPLSEILYLNRQKIS